MGIVNKQAPAYIRRSGDAKKALDQVAKNLEQVLQGIEGLTEEALDEIALTIHNNSQAYAPLDTRELRESSYIESEKTGTNYTVEIGYKADHSVYTHEIGPYKNPTTLGTGYKYLQRAATEVESDIPQIIADSLKNNLR